MGYLGSLHVLDHYWRLLGVPPCYASLPGGYLELVSAQVHLVAVSHHQEALRTLGVVPLGSLARELLRSDQGLLGVRELTISEID